MLFATIIMMSFNSFAQSWTADNGNGTFTNPLFYDEFSDPDIIRVGEDFYLAGTTMHAMPGLVVLHSKDLVNWTFLSYAFDSLSLGPEFNLRNGKEAYGQGVWAPCIRYHNGMFYIFTNVNNHGMQVYMAKDPKGPWTHKPMNSKIYDLSVLFDDDGKIYAVHSYNEVSMVELKPDMSGVVEGTEKVIIPAGNNMGEGHHIYKIKGKYYIISANYSPCGRMQCARADHPYGPYETTVISAQETMGFQVGWWASNVYMGGSLVPEPGYKFKLTPPLGNRFGAAPLHQGGIVDLPNGEWWGFSMMDFMSVGRTTCLSPVTWQDEWPYFGLPGNLGRTPRTWFKPNVAVSTKPTAPYQRSDNFDGSKLQPVWQWNHNPISSKWELNKKKGALRLHTMPAKDFLWASNTLTQRVVGPESYVTTALDASSLKQGDYAGLAYLNIPYASLGVIKNKDGFALRFYDHYTNKTIEQKLTTGKISLRATGNYEQDIAQFSYSVDGRNFINIGDSVRLPYQTKTFQGSRYALFAYNTIGADGGFADFTYFKMVEPLADRSNNIPAGKIITLTNLGTNQLVWANPHGMMHSHGKGSREASGKGVQFKVHYRGKGRVALEALNGTGFLTVVGIGISGDVRLMKEETKGSLFLWQDMLHNQCMLLSLKTNRFVGITPQTNEPYAADRPGTLPDRKDGTVFVWSEVEEKVASVPDNKFFVYLCFGQSNMEAGAKPDENDKLIDSRFQMLASVDNPKLNRVKGNWYVANPPINRPENAMGPVDFFGRTMVANLPGNYKVGVINVSVAGAKIELWDKDSYFDYLTKAENWMQNICKQYDKNPYQRLVEMARIAQKDGIIKGILLHQGESNSTDPQWPNKVKAIYDNLIKDLNLNPKEVPLLAGELKSKEENGVCHAFNTNILVNLPKTLPNSHIISSKGVKGSSDQFHFVKEGMQELGRRYAVKMLEIQGFKYNEKKKK